MNRPRTTVTHIARLSVELLSNDAACEHLRIGQLLVNACGEDLYNIENDELLRRLREYRLLTSGE